MNKNFKGVLLVSIVLLVTNVFGQSEASFESIKLKAAQQWDKNYERGDGYNAYKRWEWETETRIDTDGTIPVNAPTYKAWLDYKANLKIDRRAGLSNWTFIGPKSATGGYQGMGRLNCIAFHPTIANTYWVGSPSGGIWKTTDDGQTWSTNFDNEPVLGVSSIVINPNNPDSMYALTGDGDRGSLSGLTGAPRGDNKSLGVIISTNGGQSWDTTGLNFTFDQALLGRKLLMDPLNTRILICATLSGIYRTTDAGKTWVKTANDDFIDIAFHPTNNQIVYATTLEFGGGTKFYRSLNNGVSFSLLNTYNSGVRAAIATTEDAPNSVMILVADQSNGSYLGLYKSTNNGLGMTEIGNQAMHSNILGSDRFGNSESGQGWYDLVLAIEPNDSSIIYVGGVNNWKSTDGGATFNCLTNWWSSGDFPAVHADKHFFAFHPLKNNRFYDCNDGGVYYTDNKGNSWTEISFGLYISQLYKLTFDNDFKPTFLGGSQDNGTYGIEGDGTHYLATGGDGMECHTNQSDDDIMYGAYANGVLYRNDFKFLDRRATEEISDNLPGGKQTGAWVTPFELSKVNAGTLFAGYEQVYKSEDYGNSWTSISINFSSTGYLRNIALSNHNDQTIYTADFAKLFVTFNGGDDWAIIKSVSSSTPITDIFIDPANDSILYLTYGGYTSSRKVEKLFHDGSAWKTESIGGTLPNVAVNCITIDSMGSNEMYIGTDLGVFYRTPTMADWERFSNNLPNVVVTDLDIAPKYRKLYAATYGRGIWETNLEEVFYPVLFSPENNAIDINAKTTLNITFNKNISNVENTNIFYYEGKNAPVRLTNNTANITFMDNVLTIIADADFPIGRKVKISMDRGMLKDSDNKFSEPIDSANWQFTIEGTSGINNIRSTQVIKIYPSPASDVLNINFDKAGHVVNCKLIDLQGKEVYSSNSQEQDLKIINLKNKAKGLYMLYLSIDNQEAIAYKIVKE